jgi:hypothetical protein
MLMPSKRSFPPVVCWRGTHPSQAAHCRPVLHALASLLAATGAVAVQRPRPGIDIRHWHAGGGWASNPCSASQSVRAGAGPFHDDLAEQSSGLEWVRQAA